MDYETPEIIASYSEDDLASDAAMTVWRISRKVNMEGLSAKWVQRI